MTSARLTQLLLSFTERRCPGAPLPADKRALLELLVERCGATAALEAGREIEKLGMHPVFEALAAAPTPEALLERWMRLERFGHTRHRTRVVDRDAAGTRLSLEHYALEGDAPHPLDDLFVWGLELALLELAGFTGFEAHLETPPGAGAAHDAILLYAGGCFVELTEVPLATSRLSLTWAGQRAEREQQRERQSSLQPGRARDPLAALLERDLCASWRLGEVARELGVSPRSLQRQLAARGLTFSELVQKTRLEHAFRLLQDGRLSLTEIAFCTGFSDQAHFNRSFRRQSEIPPSAYRRLLSEG